MKLIKQDEVLFSNMSQHSSDRLMYTKLGKFFLL